MSGTVSIIPPPETQFLDSNGAPLAGGSVSTFIPGTTTPSPTWQDSAGTIVNTNPIILDAAGRALIWGSGAYRFIVKDSLGNTIYDQNTSAASSTLSQLTVTGAVSVGGALTAGSASVGPLTATATTLTTLGIAQDGGGTNTLPTAINVTRVAGTIADADLVDITQTVTHVAGDNTLAQALQVQSTVGNTYVNGVFSDGPATNVWNLSARLYSTAIRYSAAGSVDSQHISLQARAERSLPTGGVPAGKQMAEVWASYLPLTDSTNLPSSVSNSLTGMEMDCGANNVDDALARYGVNIVVGPQVALASGGYPCEWGRGISLSGMAAGGQVTGFCDFAIFAGMPYSVAVLDTRDATAMNTTVSATLGTPGTVVSVANVWGFTKGNTGGNVSVSNPANITINGHAYQQTGFTTTAGSTAGTITLTSNVSVSDGTSGNAIVGQSRAIWMANGQQIAFSADGSEYMFVDSNGAFNFMGFSGLLMKISAAGEMLVSSLNAGGGIGLYGKTDPGQQTVTGSRGGNAALASLLTALANYGIIIDGTTA